MTYQEILAKPELVILYILIGYVLYKFIKLIVLAYIIGILDIIIDFKNRKMKKPRFGETEESQETLD